MKTIIKMVWVIPTDTPGIAQGFHSLPVYAVYSEGEMQATFRNKDDAELFQDLIDPEYVKD